MEFVFLIFGFLLYCIFFVFRVFIWFIFCVLWLVYSNILLRVYTLISDRVKEIMGYVFYYGYYDIGRLL